MKQSTPNVLILSALYLSFLLLCCLSLAGNVSCLTISEVSVLLPWSSSGFTLHVNTSSSGGASHDSDAISATDSSSSSSCLHWSTDSPHLIQLQYTACSTELTVIPISSVMHELSEKKTSAIVLAEDTFTHEKVECEVYLGQLHRIEMLTSARKLYLGEVETLDIIGFDEEGNSFKSLNGLQFDWNTERITNEHKDGAIRLLPLNDATVRLSVDPIKNNNNNYDSSQTIICQGLEIGQAKVVVASRSQPQIRDEVDFSVFDKFSLRPAALLRLIPTSRVTYQLFKQDKKKQMALVPMPNPQYTWSTAKSKVATIDSRMGTLRAKDLGMTSITAKDTSFDLNQAKGTVLVVAPVKIAFKFEPLSPALYDGYEEIKKLYSSDASFDGTNLVENVKYSVQVELYDDKDKKIYLTDNIGFDIAAADEDGGVEIVERTKNMHSFVLRTNSKGRASLRARLVSDAGRLYKLSHSQMLNIYPRVSIGFTNNTIHLPVTPYIHQRYKLNAKGGSRRYKWAMLTNNVATVDSQGLLTSQFQGEEKVYVFDSENIFNGDVRVVKVSPPHALHWAPGKRETEIGSHLCLRLEMHDASASPFVIFDAFNVQFKIGDYNIYTQEKKECIDAANVYEIHAKRVGYTTVQARLSSIGELKDEIPVVAFEPLRTQTPRNEVDPIVIALGSTQPILLSGGPVEWETFQLYRSSAVSIHVKKHEEQDAIPVVHDEDAPSHNQKMSFIATCRKIGERRATFVMTNSIHVRGAEKTVVTLSRRIICAHPESMRLTPHFPVEASEDRFASNPLVPIDTNARTLSYHVSTNSSLILKIDLFDKDGHAFSAFQSLDKIYHLSNNKLAHFPDKVITYDGKRYLIIDRSEGLLISNAKLSGYNAKELRKNAVLVKAPNLSLQSPDIQLRINVPMGIMPEHLLLFNHPSVSGELRVSGGSGDFSVKVNPPFTTIHELSGRSIMLTPRAEGESTVTVQDLRFDSHPSVHASVSVANVAQVEIEGPQYVELGENIELNLRAFDKNGQEFDRRFLSAMQPSLTVHSSSRKSNIVDIRQQKSHLYQLTGLKIGTIDVIASVMNADTKIVKSQPFQIHVFPSLYVEPPTLVLIPGAKYQVKLMGGPSLSEKHSHSSTTHKLISSFVDKDLVPRSQRSDTSSVITIDKRGIITAVKYGKAVIELKRSIGAHQFASKNVEVYVVRLSSLRFSNSLTMYDDSHLPVQFQSMSTDGFTVGALSVQSPFFSLSYTVEDPDVVKIVEPSSSHGHVTIFEALQPGQAGVNVVARFIHPHLEDYQLTSDMMIRVEERLRLVGYCTSKIIVPPNSKHRVEANRESARFYIQPTSERGSSIRVGETSGRLSASGEGSAILQIRDVLTGQSVVSKVEVDEPEYMNLDMNSHVLMLPLGSTRALKFYGLNKHAEKMACLDSVKVQVRSNMYEHLEVSLQEADETLHIHALATGNTTLQLYAPSMDHTFDFKVVVVSTIRPSHPVLLIGDKLHFHLAADNEKQGLWKTADASILRVDPIEGVATAVAPGSTQILFNSDSMSTSSQVEVKKISSALLSTSKKHLLIPLRKKSSRVFRIPVAFYDQDREYISLDTADSAPYQSLDRKLSIECQSTNSVIRVVKSELDKEKIACIVQQNYGAVSSISEPRMETVRFVIHISNHLDSYTIQSDPFFVNLTDVPLASVAESGMYLEGESFSQQARSKAPGLFSRILSLKNYLSQIFIFFLTILIAVAIYKFSTIVAYRLTRRGVRAMTKRNIPQPDMDFRSHRSQFDSNGIRMRR